MNSINIDLVNKRLVEVLYFIEVLIPHLRATISESERESNVLIELFHNQFFYELYKKLENKCQVFEVYLEDLLEMKKDFDLHVESNEKLKLEEDESEYESLLIQGVSELSILIKILKIEMKEILDKKDRNYENNTQNNNSCMLNY